MKRHARPISLRAWELRVLGFLLPGWLAAMHTLAGAAWKHWGLGEASLLLSALSFVSYLAIPVGLLQAVLATILSSDCDARRLARWFLYGTGASIPVAVLAMPVRFL